MTIIQLWTNSDETEFAIRRASDTIGFRASTSNTADYVKVADEMHEMYDQQQIDWPFMLERWIASWKDGFRHSALLPPYEWELQKGAERHAPAPPFSVSEIKQQQGRRAKRRRKSRRKKLTVKCRFCNLMFYNDVERLTHEKEWHPSKSEAK
ncbi:hypothetical protein [Nitrososphaera viennensis]|uniref:C2H2-type domain-containing protein n=2 Tax=Nitrososphaera viennensis TaxID=1034015 RepID=A0A060HQT2_9ARCH|nr:hypothetical protein [Nitrososphaera viennensis]AIC15886.1 hypothetical protein NVIE_016340 [Nitrososphaera viennensis EN76]UVS67873.1 hypothetical protein NWT39_08135 [Nitrososphaera viennensis]